MVLSLRRRPDAWQRLHGKPSRERHFISMMFSIAAVLSLAAAVGLPWWAVGGSSNGKCFFDFGLVSVRATNNEGVTKTFSCELHRARTYGEAIPLSSSCHVVSCYSSVCSDPTIAGFYALHLFLPKPAYSMLYVVVGVKGHCLRTVVQRSLAGDAYSVCHRTSSISR